MQFNDVEKIIKQEINKEVKVIKRFLGGMSNFTFLIECEGELFTYRIPGKNSEVFINREIEKKNIDLVDQLNINCDNVYLNLVNGHKMAKYIDGDDLSQNIDYTSVANTLKKLHNSGIKASNNMYKKDRINYLEGLHKQKLDIDYIKLRDEMIELDKKFDVDFVFCHGDSQKSNWVNSKKLYLLDWEYSCNHDFYYDIACFGNVDFEDAIKLLEVYLNKKLEVNELNRLYFNRFYQCLQWYNVALYKEEIGLSEELKINFLEVSRKYIELAKKFRENIALI